LQFKEYHFYRCEGCTSRTNLFQPDFFIRRPPGGDRIRDYFYTVVLLQQVHGGLIDTDMRFNSGQEYRCDIQTVQYSIESGILPTTKFTLGHRLLILKQRFKRANSGSKLLRDVFGPNNGERKQLNSLNQQSQVTEQLFTVRLDLGQFTLYINQD